MINKREYLAYLLKQDAPWRATLENPHSGERLSFASLTELCGFLESKTSSAVQPEKSVDPLHLSTSKERSK